MRNKQTEKYADNGKAASLFGHKSSNVATPEEL